MSELRITDHAWISDAVDGGLCAKCGNRRERHTPMTNPTERPEERDSRLAEIEKWHKPIWVHDHGANLCNIDRQHWPCDARILLNEATSLRRRLEETSWELADERAGLRRAEAEVKELREESRFLALRLKEAGGARETFEGMYRNAESECWRWRTLAEETRAERKQMEEALRERFYGDTPACYTEASGYHGCVCWTGPRAALSPSDTEEPR